MAIPIKPGLFPDRVISSLKSVPPPSPIIEILLAEGFNPSLQRNRAGELAQGDILYLFDNDIIVPPHLFHRVIPHFSDEKVIAVGGPSLTPDNDTFLQKCFGYVLASPFGSYRSSSRYSSRGSLRSATDVDLIGCNLALRKKIFQAEGGLNPLLHPNEENELLDRLLEKGYIMLYDPEAYVYRSQRESIGKFILQLFIYGAGRMEQTILRPSRIRPFYFATIVFSLYVVLLPFLKDIHWTIIPLLIYLFLAVVEAFRISWNNKTWACFPIIPCIFFLMHISHGCGIFWGLVRLPLKQRISRLSSEDIRVTRYEGRNNLPPS